MIHQPEMGSPGSKGQAGGIEKRSVGNLTSVECCIQKDCGIAHRGRETNGSATWQSNRFSIDFCLTHANGLLIIDFTGRFVACPPVFCETSFRKPDSHLAPRRRLCWACALRCRIARDLPGKRP
jgi:hypothetical protein